MSTKILVLTCGLPRSGKSTWARQQGFPIVNPDALRLALHGQVFAPNAEPLVWATARWMTRSLFLAGHDIVILDSTNITRARRDEWLSQGDREWLLCFQPFPTDVITCRHRAVADGKPELLGVIEKMERQREPLQADELLWEDVRMRREGT